MRARPDSEDTPTEMSRAAALARKKKANQKKEAK
jgi:hypothetical protein